MPERDAKAMEDLRFSTGELVAHIEKMEASTRCYRDRAARVETLLDDLSEISLRLTGGENEWGLADVQVFVDQFFEYGESPAEYGYPHEEWVEGRREEYFGGIVTRCQRFLIPELQGVLDGTVPLSTELPVEDFVVK